MTARFNFQSLFSSPSKQHIENESEKLIAHTKSFVAREDLIADIIEKYKKRSTLSADEQLALDIQTYLALETFITKNKPLVVQKIFTKETLREEIRNQIDLQKIPVQLRLIFLTSNDQLFSLFCIYTQTLVAYVFQQTGSTHIQEIIEPVIRGTKLEDVKVGANNLDFSHVQQNTKDVSTEELTNAFHKLNTALFLYITSSYGAKSAIDLTEKNYQSLKNRYDYELLSKYLSAIPPGVLDKERVAYMTREEIEEKIKDQTKELSQEKDELKNANEKINLNFRQAQRNEAKLLASVSGLSLGFILTDITENIMIINDQAKKILQLPTEVKTIQELANRISFPIVLMDVIQECKQEKQSKEFTEIDLNESILHLTFTPIFLKDQQNEFIGTVILINDITKEKLLERTKDEFFAIASHELRTPLTAIKGSVSVLKNYFGEAIADAEIQTLVSYIDQSSTRLINIVNEFLNVSRLEQGRMVFNNERFNLTGIADEVIGELSNLAEKKKIFLRFEAPRSEEVSVFADKEKTKQVVINLVGNAVKFTETGGVSLSVEIKDGFGYLRVHDTGVGISNENQQLLFRKFQQADKNILTHDASKGTGLGLYISKRLIEKMGGKIYLENSEQSKGSTFIFSLPLTETAPASS